MIEPRTATVETRHAGGRHLALIVLLGMAACAAAATGQTVAVADASTRCADLAGVKVSASAFAQETGGAVVTQAVAVPSEVATGTPAYCKATGSIDAAKAGDLPILFQVNLPAEWNRKTVQFGGAGSNGVVINGTGNVVNAGPAKTPLARGYVTFGSDSGHAGPGREFYLNAQARANYGHESVKKTRDLAVALIQAYYKTAPTRSYYIGHSKGGQEGLHAAQRYAADYDGVVAYYPAAQNPSLILSWFRMWEAAYRVPGGALSVAKATLLHRQVMAACDGLDGAADGIVSNLEACKTQFSVQALRCPGGADTGDACLSDPQIAALDLGASAMSFAFPMVNGVSGIGPYPVYNGGDLLGIWFSASGRPEQSGYFGFTDGTIRHSFLRSAAATTTGFDYRAHQREVLAQSESYDASNPNLDAFAGKGGKLLLVQGTTDMLVPPAMTTSYFSRLTARYGNRLRDFARYYVVPGFGHGSGAFTMQWDSLSTLDDWVESGKAPESPVATDGAAATKGRTRPLCEYPAWPRYNGAGDLNSAANYTCVAG